MRSIEAFCSGVSVTPPRFWFSESYRLEVSSPGLERELTKDSDYKRFAGRLVNINTYEPINEKKHFSGILIGKENSVVSIDIEGEKLEIPEKKISKINLEIIF